MKNSTLLIAALIAAAALWLASCTECTRPHADTPPIAAAASLAPVPADTAILAPAATNATASKYPPVVYEETRTNVCPDHYVTRKGDKYLVYTGPKGGCYYLNDTGNKIYLKK